MRILSYPPLIQHLNFSKSERPSWWTHLQSSSSELSWAPQFRTWLHTSDLNAATIFFVYCPHADDFFENAQKKRIYSKAVWNVRNTNGHILFLTSTILSLELYQNFRLRPWRLNPRLSSFSLAWCLWRQSDNGFRFSINSSLSDISSQRTFVSLIPEVIHWKEQIFIETYHQREEI